MRKPTLVLVLVGLVASGCRQPEDAGTATAKTRPTTKIQTELRKPPKPWSLGADTEKLRTEPVKFVRPPTVVKEGGGVLVKFAVNTGADVAVYVEDAKGRIVRHLAAGMLGKNAPEPLAAGSLAQSLFWDRKDDLGKPVPAGKYQVRVAAGLQANHAGTAFTEKSGPGNITGEVMGLAAGAGGRVYVLTRRWHSGHWNATSVHVFCADGTYEKTIKPFPSNVPPERLKGVGALEAPDGRALPVVHRVVAMSFYPWEDMPHQMAVTPNRRLQMVVVGAGYDKKPIQYLAAIDCSDGAPYEGYPGTPLLGRANVGRLHLAPASDGKAVYLTGLNSRSARVNVPGTNPPVVYRVDLDTRGPAKPFFGEPEGTGKDENHLRDPRGIATDGQGHLFVADFKNDRVVVVREKDRKFVRAVTVPAPTWVGVHHKTGALYVRSGDAVIKFSTWRRSEEAARLKLPPVSERDKDRVRWHFALAHEAEPAVLWVGRSRGGGLMRCVDRGREFGPLEKAGYHPSRRLWNISVGQQRREVACKVGWRTLRILDEATGKMRDLRPTGSPGQTYRLGPNGQVYGIDHWKYGIRRWDRNGRYMPFKATVGDKELGGRLRSRPSGTTSWERDFCVDRAGSVYVKHRGKHYHGRMRVDVYDRDGNFKRTAIWVVTDGALGPRVDLRGNLYLADAIKPLGRRHPEALTDRLPSVLSSRQYTWMYGSMVKFGPQGGAIWFPIRTQVDEYGFDGEPKLDPSLPKEKVSSIHSGRLYYKPAVLQGALWWRFDCSYVLDMHRAHNIRCHCTAMEFDIDDFGRVFYPDQGRFRIVVRDTNGNAILKFGGYGNQDSCGPASYVFDPKTNVLRSRRADDPPTMVSPFAQPEIAFAWIVGLGVSDKYVYAADALNRRVLRVGLSYECDTRVAVP